MTTTASEAAMPPLRWFALGLNLAATAAGAWLCFDFGARAGGGLIGVMAAINGAALCSLLTSALADRWLPRRSG
jgi:hypothetical protein